MDRGAGWAIVPGAAKSQTRLRDSTAAPGCSPLQSCLYIMSLNELSKNAELESCFAAVLGIAFLPVRR